MTGNPAQSDTVNNTISGTTEFVFIFIFASQSNIPSASAGWFLQRLELRKGLHDTQASWFQGRFPNLTVSPDRKNEILGIQSSNRLCSSARFTIWSFLHLSFLRSIIVRTRCLNSPVISSAITPCR